MLEAMPSDGSLLPFALSIVALAVVWCGADRWLKRWESPFAHLDGGLDVDAPPPLQSPLYDPSAETLPAWPHNDALSGVRARSVARAS